MDIATVPLTIDRQGTGTGAVTASGLSCAGGASTQAVPCSATYPFNTVVTLAAVPDAGNTFAGLSGACTGTCQVTMVARAGASHRDGECHEGDVIHAWGWGPTRWEEARHGVVHEAGDGGSRSAITTRM